MKKIISAQNKTSLRKKNKTAVKEHRTIKPWLALAVVMLLLALTWVLYKPSLTNNHFTNWDDPAYVLENTQVKQFGAESATYFFTHASATNYHPLTMLSLSWDYYQTIKDKRQFRETDELEAVRFHTTSLLFHLLNVVLVFFLAYLLSRKRLIVAAVTALLFAIHPMHVESIAWIAERKDVLYSFFFLAGLILYVKYLERKGMAWLVAAGVAFVASLFSKPSAVVFPLILLSIDYFYGRKFTPRVYIEKIPFFILAILFGVITFIIQSHTAVAGIKAVTLFQRIMFGSYGFIMYPFKLLVPVDISAFYPFPITSSSEKLPVIFYLAPLIACAIIALVYYSMRITRVISFGFLFYFFSVVLVLQFMPVGSAVMADRYSYMSSIGLFFIVAWYLDQTFIRKEKIFEAVRWVLTGVFLIYIIFIGLTAYNQTMVWKNSETLWTDVIAKYPRAETSYKQRGNYYGSLNMTDKALQDFMTFIRLKQDDAGVYSSLGNTYGLRGETEKALAAYSKSVALDSLDPKTFINRGITYTKARLFTQGVKDFNKALSLSPGALEVYSNRCYAFKDMGDYEHAIADFSLLIQYFPRNDNYFMQRGICYFQLKKYSSALTDFEQCVAIIPVNGNAFFNMSVTYNEMKDFRKANEYASKAVSAGYHVDKNYLETLKKKAG